MQNNWNKGDYMSESGNSDPMATCEFTLMQNLIVRGIGWERIDGKRDICGTLETAFFA
jgi:hypothetical protein